MSKTKIKTPSNNKLGGRILFNMILFGFMGQVAWNVENMFFNTFLFNSVYADAPQTAVDGTLGVVSAINIMVAASAATAVITTFIMGALSDRLRRRKLFISVGYMIWGVTVGVFGVITKDNTAALFHLSDPVKILAATVTIVIVMDCVMTFMGSTANDSAFNAWVTDVTTIHNRGTAESILAIMPIGAMVIVMALAGMIGAIGYSAFFLGLGAMVLLCGVVGIFTLKDSLDGERVSGGNYFAELIYGFRPSVVKENSRLYLTLVSAAVFNIAVQVFFPYIFIYLQHGLGLDLNALLASLTPAKIAVALVAVIAVVAAIIGIGKLVDKYGKKNFILVSVLLFMAGLFAAFFADTLLKFLVCIVPALIGYGMLMIMFNAAIRDFTPEDKVGLFQGVRMIFIVLLPMVIGPTIGNFTIRYFETVPYTNDYGIVTECPGRSMFMAAAVVSLMIFLPVLILRKKGIDVKENKK
ncbi:MAG: MFS transporter [Clostridia bacterium]|nr:MFS transporter [Clostridia bacterium]